MTPTTSSPWTPKVRCNFTRSPPRSPALGVLDAADATKSNNCCCGDAFCRARGAGPVAGGEAGAAESPLEGAFQIPDSFGLALWRRGLPWAQGSGLCLDLAIRAHIAYCFAQRVFAGFLLGYAAFLVYSSFHHAWSPWELVGCLLLSTILPFMMFSGRLCPIVDVHLPSFGAPR